MSNAGEIRSVLAWMSQPAVSDAWELSESREAVTYSFTLSGPQTQVVRRAIKRVPLAARSHPQRVSVREASEYTGLSARRIRFLISNDLLSAVKVGGRWSIQWSSLMQHIQSLKNPRLLPK